MSASHAPLVRTRLSIMMFLQFAIWGGWCFAMPGYAMGVLQFDGGQIGWIMSTTAIGAIIAPLFVGYVADRLFATERILAIMHLLGGVCLLTASQVTSYSAILWCMMFNGLFYMPTMALANSLAFRHIPDPAKFPRVALLGTIGWIASNLVVATLGGTDNCNFFFVSGGAAILMALYCLTLPHTPPKGGATGSVLGLDALKLLKQGSFLIFTFCAFSITVVAAIFFVVTTPMLQERGYPSPIALMTLNQFAEIVFMFTMPLFVARLGLKMVLSVGMFSWVARYALFATGSFPAAILGLLMHGFCYSFVFVGAYMYVDKRAPSEIKASAQSLIAFLMLGVGWFLGTQLGGILMEKPDIKAAITSMAAGEKKKASLPTWSDPMAATSAWRFLDLPGMANRLITGKRPEPKKDLGTLVDTNGDGVITREELDKVPEAGLKIGEDTYSRADLVSVFQRVADWKAEKTKEKVPAELSVSRADWLEAQSHNWKLLWFFPVLMGSVICGLFVVLFRDPEVELPSANTEQA